MNSTFSSLQTLMAATRTCRRFQESLPVEEKTLRELVALTRLAGSARNLQPLRYLLVNDPEQNQKIYPHLLWAGYLSEWPGPSPGERPAAYIVCLLDRRLAAEAECDLGIATQNILLGATALGLAGCRIGGFSREVHRLLKLPDHYQIVLVVALGHPLETVQMEEAAPGEDIRYWRDAAGVHHVPKRRLKELIVKV